MVWHSGVCVSTKRFKLQSVCTSNKNELQSAEARASAILYLSLIEAVYMRAESSAEAVFPACHQRQRLSARSALLVVEARMLDVLFGGGAKTMARAWQQTRPQGGLVQPSLSCESGTWKSRMLDCACYQPQKSHQQNEMRCLEISGREAVSGLVPRRHL